jgi:acyl carrier protein
MREGVEQASRRQAFRQGLIDFINDTLPQLHELKRTPNVDGQTPLFESGLIDSLGVLHLIAFVEKSIGRRLPTRLVTMKHFRTVDAICEAFATEQRSEEATCTPN